jgi:hypothetical protein
MFFRKCKWCGKSFQSSYQWQEYCGKECYKEHRKVYARELYKKNYPNRKEKISAKNKLWRLNHPDYSKEWREKNRKQIREYHRRYVKKLLEKNPNYFLKYGGEYKYNYCSYDGLSYNKYKELTRKCSIKNCGFSITVDLHHIDKNRDNNEISNLMGLCPNHHQMIHRLRYELKSENNSWLLIKPK